MEFILIKPLSINKAYKGRRFKTNDYKNYEKDLHIILPNVEIPDGKLEVHLEFGFSNKGSDFDNPVKPFIDIMQKKYGFNDNRIYRSIIDKYIVKKGDEYIKFKFLKLKR